MKTLCHWLALGAAITASTTAGASPVQISDPFAVFGINDAGGLGSGGVTSPGIEFDASGTSNFGVHDVLTPGGAFEGYYISSNARSWEANNLSVDGSAYMVTSPKLLGPTSARWSSVTMDGVLGITSTYTLTSSAATGSTLAINTRIDNLSAVSLDNLAFLRTLDPDPDYNGYGTFDTVNWLKSPTEACAGGVSSHIGICLFSSDASHTGVAGVSSGWSTKPADYLAGQHAGDGDYAIGLAYSLGTLRAGESVSLSYGYSLAGFGSGGPSPVPEPESVAMMLAGLGALTLVRRKRR